MIEGHPELVQLQYPWTLVHSLLVAGEEFVLHLVLFESFEGRSSSFCYFPSSLEGDSIKLGDQVGILSLA